MIGEWQDNEKLFDKVRMMRVFGDVWFMEGDKASVFRKASSPRAKEMGNQ